MNGSSHKLTRLASAAGFLVVLAAFVTAAALAGGPSTVLRDSPELALPSQQLDPAIARAIAAHSVAPTPFDMRSPDTRDAAIAVRAVAPTPFDMRSPDTRDAAIAARAVAPTRLDMRSPDTRDAFRPAEDRPDDRPGHRRRDRSPPKRAHARRGAGRSVEGLRLGQVRRDRRCGPGGDRSARRGRPRRTVASWRRRGDGNGQCRLAHTASAAEAAGAQAGTGLPNEGSPGPFRGRGRGVECADPCHHSSVTACSASHAFAMRFCARVSHASTTISSSSSASSRASAGMRTSTAGYPLKWGVVK